MNALSAFIFFAIGESHAKPGPDGMDDEKQPDVLAVEKQERRKAGSPKASRSSAEMQREYEDALILLKQGLYVPAHRAFRVFLDTYPRSPLADDAQYWAAEASYIMRDFGQAASEFEELVNRYPESPKLRNGLLKLGYNYCELRRWQDARKVFLDLMAQFPNTNEAERAETQVKRLRESGHCT